MEPPKNDGQNKVEMGPGDIHWGADTAGGAVHGQIGHRSGQLGDVPCVQLMVQFHDSAEAALCVQEFPPDPRTSLCSNCGRSSRGCGDPGYVLGDARPDF